MTRVVVESLGGKANNEFRALMCEQFIVVQAKSAALSM